MNVIYIHGFNSGSNSSTVDRLRICFPKMVAVDYTFTDAQKAEDELSAAITEVMMTGPTLLIGSSLGGYWANKMASKYMLPCVLINPCIYPNISLLKYIGRQKSFATGNEYDFTRDMVDTYLKVDIPDRVVERIMLIGLDDKVMIFDNECPLAKMSKVVYLPGEGHQLNDFTPVINSVLSIQNQIGYEIV